MTTFARSITPLLRTSRLAIRQQRDVNPLHQVFGRDRTGLRGLATVFERNKPHVNIGMLTQNVSPNEIYSDEPKVQLVTSIMERCFPDWS